ncbi:putative HAD-superfamily subfamily IA hydrolase, REG-2-like protein [Crocosphaera subtropica ATCC 51142]|uniref:HAD-superfamily subfamily IA hydrolase, REG-2-like protein n=1 Tax=Crocosphaera subtropica (strain ATCC 51142 / BH68) TaxID=43989 RepID=B1WZD9_CROS5|nr:HAD-IA family hydrolase [Crocosphaera subtropica]ACB49505.1 putative HAD-superfamily subfamily IA hydrolase, REG-2-like protein [Crocosphaera subtropica ATCC 51142]
MKQPKVIFFDAVGTLFGVKGSVGEVYSYLATQVGVQCDPQKLETAFFKQFKKSPPLAFRGVDIMAVSDLEYQWWYQVAYDTYQEAEVMDQFKDFDGFFRQLYDYFATPHPWFLYTDVFPALQHWQKQGIPLGIISNFDSRIYEVLDLFGLSNFFQTITISSTTGTAKPDVDIFIEALKKHQCQPKDAWHIGDSKKEDYEGAKAAGINAFLLERNGDIDRSDYTIVNSMEMLI